MFIKLQTGELINSERIEMIATNPEGDGVILMASGNKIYVESPRELYDTELRLRFGIHDALDATLHTFRYYRNMLLEYDKEHKDEESIDSTQE